MSPRYWFSPSFFFFVLFLGLHLQHMEVPRLGAEWELQPRPTPQPQQHLTQTVSAAHSAACSNARFSTHWVRPGIEPASSRRHQVLNQWATVGTPALPFFVLISLFSFLSSEAKMATRSSKIPFYCLVIHKWNSMFYFNSWSKTQSHQRILPQSLKSRDGQIIWAKTSKEVLIQDICQLLTKKRRNSGWISKWQCPVNWPFL